MGSDWDFGSYGKGVEGYTYLFLDAKINIANENTDRLSHCSLDALEQKADEPLKLRFI